MMDEEFKNIPPDYYSLKLTAGQFDKISTLVYRVSGIDLHEGKEELIKARLLKRLRHLRISDFEGYLKYLERDKSGTEIGTMVDFLTTNKTNFFRESKHLDFLKDEILPGLSEGPIRIWSAGCSSGEEPYSIAIILTETIPAVELKDVKILATDISDRMIERARRAVYDEESIKTLPPQMRHKYFIKADVKPHQGRSHGSKYTVIPQLHSLVSFAKLNLMDEWPMRGLFDIIFCRNVMIYFDKPTQEKLIGRFWSMLREGGYLFVGHSESLTFLAHDFHYLKPAVYQKTRFPAKADRKPAWAKRK